MIKSNFQNQKNNSIFAENLVMTKQVKNSMKHTRLIHTLKHLFIEEMDNIEKFLQSPYHTKSNNNYIILFRTLRQYHPEFGNDNLTNDYILEKAFPEILNSEKGKELLDKIVPMWNNDLTKELFERELKKSKKALKL